MKKQISIEGMSCNHCVNHVKNALEDLGATNIEVSLEKKMATIDVGNTDNGSIRETIKSAGYEVVKIEDL